MTIPIPEKRIERFEKLAYGMFIHWGLYSLLGRGEWIMSMENIPVSEYARLKDDFTAEDFDGHAIAKLAKSAGMKYICLTTRHHDGFSLYDTRGLCDFDAVHSPAGRDLVAEFVEGCRKEDIVPFLYHTTLDWYQESFENDFDAYLEYLNKSVEILCTNYGPIGGLWFDGNWSKPDADWKLDRLYGTIRKYQPDAIIVDNTGLHARGAVGHPEIDSVTFERGRPTPMDRDGMKKYVAAEMNHTMNMHWAIAGNDFCYISPREFIESLCACRKVGANYLLNVGPTAAGKIPDYETAVLRRIGDWIRISGDIIYNGKPVTITGSGEDFALEAGGRTYLFIHGLTIKGDAHVVADTEGIGQRSFTGIKKKINSATWLDNGEELTFDQNIDTGKLNIEATGYPYGTQLVVRVAELT